MVIQRLKEISNHSVSRNSAALFALQFVSMVAPLIVLPYLSRVLGIDGFGLVMLALSACAMGLVITDFGFNISATYTISKRREDKAYVCELIGAIFLIKVILVIFLLSCIFLYNYYMNSSMERYTLSFYIGLNIIVQAFLPTWFFQGIERMKNVTIYMVVAKVSYVFLVFIYINDKSDFNLVILLFAISNFVAVSIGIMSIYTNGYTIKRPKSIGITEVFKDSSQFFLSRAAVSVYTSASTFLVGAFSGVQQAAMYGASEKLYQASQSVTLPVSQALFPYMAKNKDSQLLYKVIIALGVPLSIGAVACGYWASDILVLIFGKEFSAATSIMRIFLVVTVITFISINFGYPAFAKLGKIHIANHTVIIGAVVQLSCLTYLYYIDSLSALYVVFSVLITESVVMVLRVFLYTLYKKHII